MVVSQVERIGALLTQVIIKSNEIATNTRRGAANFAIASLELQALSKD